MPLLERFRAARTRQLTKTQERMLGVALVLVFVALWFVTGSGLSVAIGGGVALLLPRSRRTDQGSERLPNTALIPELLKARRARRAEPKSKLATRAALVRDAGAEWAN
jgi:hypothetical protein